MILALLFFGLAIYGFVKMVSSKPNQNTNNPYIKKHAKKLENDINYQNYLKWCQQNGEIPMDKAVFLKDVEAKENQIKNLFK